MPPPPGRGARVADTLTALPLGVAAVLTFWQIVARHVGRHLPLPPALVNVSYTEELVRYLFVWAMLAGTVAAALRREHLHLELWSAFAGGRVRGALGFTRRLAWAAFGLVLAIGGTRAVLLQWRTHQTSAALGWPVVWVGVALPLCGAGLALLALRRERGSGP